MKKIVPVLIDFHCIFCPYNASLQESKLFLYSTEDKGNLEQHIVDTIFIFGLTFPSTMEK